MRLKTFTRILFAASLAFLIGFGLFAEGASARPPAYVYTAQFRSNPTFDGFVRESGEDTWVGGSVNTQTGTIFVGDDYARRLIYLFLDFNTAPLPDGVVITSATLSLRVTAFPTQYGNPYAILGDLYVDQVVPYFGTYLKLEASDFQAMPYFATDHFSRATRAGVWITANLSGFSSINLVGHTQYGAYFLDDNNDSYSQGIRVASGNYSWTPYRPLLTVYYTYP